MAPFWPFPSGDASIALTLPPRLTNAPSPSQVEQLKSCPGYVPHCSGLSCDESIIHLRYQRNQNKDQINKTNGLGAACYRLYLVDDQIAAP